jgi:hypothetical protein
MRLVTWNLGHRQNGHRRPARLVTALMAIEPDIVVLVDRTPGSAARQLLDALGDAGLVHRHMTGLPASEGVVLLASSTTVEPGVFGADAAEAMPSAVVHAYLPSGNLDVVSIRTRGRREIGSTQEERWVALLRSASALKQRRTILVGEFGGCGGAATGAPPVICRVIADGWHHALPAEGARYTAAGDHDLCADHAFLSPLLRQVDVRCPLEAGGQRLAGRPDALSDRPPLVVDLQ